METEVIFTDVHTQPGRITAACALGDLDTCIHTPKSQPDMHGLMGWDNTSTLLQPWKVTDTHTQGPQTQAESQPNLLKEFTVTHGVTDGV